MKKGNGFDIFARIAKAIVVLIGIALVIGIIWFFAFWVRNTGDNRPDMPSYYTSDMEDGDEDKKEEDKDVKYHVEVKVFIEDVPLNDFFGKRGGHIYIEDKGDDRINAAAKKKAVKMYKKIIDSLIGDNDISFEHGFIIDIQNALAHILGGTFEYNGEKIDNPFKDPKILYIYHYETIMV